MWRIVPGQADTTLITKQESDAINKMISTNIYDIDSDKLKDDVGITYKYSYKINSDRKTGTRTSNKGGTLVAFNIECVEVPEHAAAHGRAAVPEHAAAHGHAGEHGPPQWHAAHGQAAAPGQSYPQKVYFSWSVSLKPAGWSEVREGGETYFILNGKKIKRGQMLDQKWREYIDDKTRHPYYSNGITSTWEPPVTLHETQKENYLAALGFSDEEMVTLSDKKLIEIAKDHINLNSRVGNGISNIPADRSSLYNYLNDHKSLFNNQKVTLDLVDQILLKCEVGRNRTYGQHGPLCIISCE
jgi:hypothetical protein